MKFKEISKKFVIARSTALKQSIDCRASLAVTKKKCHCDERNEEANVILNLFQDLQILDQARNDTPRLPRSLWSIAVRVFRGSLKNLIFILQVFISISVVGKAAFICNLYAMEFHEKLENPSLEEQARAIDKLFICQKCQGQRLDESNSPFAQKIRTMIREEVKKKQSTEDIVQKLAQHYGKSILLKPEITPYTWALWWAPWIILGLSIITLLGVYFKKKRQ